MPRFSPPIAALALSTIALSCTPKGASMEQLMSRATFDFECPRPQLRVLELGDRARGVMGCGRRLTYVEVCENRIDGMHCTWVINGPQWQYGPAAHKRPPTPEAAFHYSAPPPSPSVPPGQPTAAPSVPQGQPTATPPWPGPPPTVAPAPPPQPTATTSATTSAAPPPTPPPSDSPAPAPTGSAPSSEIPTPYDAR